MALSGTSFTKGHIGYKAQESVVAHPRMGVDTATPTGRLMVNLLGSIAQFEREVMLERQREGIAKAKAEGKYKGRKPTARTKAPEIIRLRRENMSNEDIAAKLNIGIASVYRVLKVHREHSSKTSN